MYMRLMSYEMERARHLPTSHIVQCMAENMYLRFIPHELKGGECVPMNYPLWRKRGKHVPSTVHRTTHELGSVHFKLCRTNDVLMSYDWFVETMNTTWITILFVPAVETRKETEETKKNKPRRQCKLTKWANYTRVKHHTGERPSETFTRHGRQQGRHGTLKK